MAHFKTEKDLAIKSLTNLKKKLKKLKNKKLNLVKVKKLLLNLAYLTEIVEEDF